MKNTSQEDLPYQLALFAAPNIGPHKYKILLEHFPNIKDLFYMKESELLYYAIPKSLISYLKKPSWHLVEEALLWQQEKNHEILFIEDDRYPEQLKEISSAPPILFIDGELSSLHQIQIAMVGSRNPSHYGLETARHFANAIAQYKICITSGLAIGIDAASHEGCLETSTKTFAVIGSGLKQIYPKRHLALAEKIRHQGAIISEFFPNTPPLAENFPRRNRIISGLSKGVLVVEAAPQSGSLITARYANEQGREVFAIPGSIHQTLSKGCHKLIREGAVLVESVDDILKEIGISSQISLSKSVKVGLQDCSQLDQEHIKLLESLGFDTLPIDSIIARTGMSADKITIYLTELELQGYVQADLRGYSKVII